MDFTAVSYYIQTLQSRYLAYYETHKAMSASEIVRDVNMNLDYDFYGHIEKVKDPNALSVICNKYYQLPSDFTPENLKSVPEGYFVADGKSYQLKQNALDAFITMSDAAKSEGLSLRIISAYRSNSYQANLYQKYKNNNGQTAADRFSARPGHSEHETGLAIDINDVAQAFENTKEFAWLSENAHKYGYVLRYPEGKETITGYMYEPWHYRYLGAEVATQLKSSGLTYDAYYAMYLLK
jgi:D-alanyl-D-alanine carboxypeptidase